MSDTVTLDLISDEADRAESRYGPFASSHEGYGVLAEEVSELLDAIRSGDLGDVKAEAIQVSAVALRIACGCSIQEFRERSVR